jgi:hypothetical protein
MERTVALLGTKARFAVKDMAERDGAALGKHMDAVQVILGSTVLCLLCRDSRGLYIQPSPAMPDDVAAWLAEVIRVNLVAST